MLTFYFSLSFLKIVNAAQSSESLPGLLATLGMVSYHLQPPSDPSDCYTVMLDGKMIGWIDGDIIQSVVERLRVMKVLKSNRVGFPKMFTTKQAD